MKIINEQLTYKERAQIYDIEYTESSDHVFLKKYIEAATDILEVPCGTGRNILLYDNKKVCFVDIEIEMIEKIKKKTNDSNFSFICGDICTFNAMRKFDLIIVPREAFQLLIDEKTAIQALQNLYVHLKPLGKLIIDIYRFGKIEQNNQEPIYYNHKVNEGKYVINWSRSSKKFSIKRFSMYETNGEIVKIRYKYEFGKSIKYSEIQMMNYDYNKFLKLIIRTGLRVQQVFGDYNFSQYTSKDNRMIFVVEKDV